MASGILLILLCLAGKTLLASWYSAKVNTYLERWQHSGRIYAPTHWQDAFDASELALRLAPGNPDHLQQQASLLEWRALGDFSPEPGQDLARAEALLWASARQRPVWPRLWTDIAALRWRQGQLGEDFTRLLHNADRFGPHQVQVHLALGRIGTALWQQLDAPARRLILRHIHQGLQRPASRPAIRRLLDNSAHRTVICADLQLVDDTACR